MNFAVLGLGIIGSAWARNLIADGHAVRCWNRTPRDFPNFYPSIQDAVEEAEAIFVIVADPPAVQSVLDQIASHLGPDKIVVQSSRISASLDAGFEACLAHEEEICAPLDADERKKLVNLCHKLVRAHGLTPGVHPGFRRL